MKLAIVKLSAGQALHQHIRAVEFLVLDASSFFRELVVTGTPSAAGLPPPPSPPNAVAAIFSAGSNTISWTAAPQAVGYTVLRSISGAGNYAPVGSVVGQPFFIDDGVEPNTGYTYEVTASGNGDSATSNPSAAITTPDFGATAYIYQRQWWQGSPTITENVPQIDYSGFDYSSQFPLVPGFDANSFSAFIEGKITTDLAGPYTFVAPTDDDGYLWVNGQLVSADPGLNVHGRSPAHTSAISLAAHTAYDFVFLENNRVGQWDMSMFWQEPTAGGAAAPRTLVPATQLTPAVDPPPTPADPPTVIQSGNSVQINWSVAADASSYAYVVQRAPADSKGNPLGQFVTIGQIFSGPASASAVASAAWGATTALDTTAVVGDTYVYRVGPVLPSQALPTSFSPISRAVTPGSLPLSVSGKLPAFVIAGQKISIHQTLTVTNGSGGPLSGLATAELFLSGGTTTGSDAIALPSKTSRKLKLNPHQHVALTLNLKSLPPTVSAGTYHLVTELIDSNGNAAVAASDGTITVASPQIDLSGSFSKIAQPSRDGRTAISFLVSNAGNIAAIGLLAFNIDNSLDGDLADATTLARFTRKINIKNGKSTRITAVVTLPKGSYFLVVQLDPTDDFKDTNLANNAFASSAKITVS